MNIVVCLVIVARRIGIFFKVTAGISVLRLQTHANTHTHSPIMHTEKYMQVCVFVTGIQQQQQCCNSISCGSTKSTQSGGSGKVHRHSEIHTNTHTIISAYLYMYVLRFNASVFAARSV